MATTITVSARLAASSLPNYSVFYYIALVHVLLYSLSACYCIALVHVITV